MVLDRKTNFFLGKTKTQSFTSWKLCGQSPKRLFFVFPRKKLVFHAETNFPLGKRWFCAEKLTYS